MAGIGEVGSEQEKSQHGSSHLKRHGRFHFKQQATSVGAALKAAEQVAVSRESVDAFRAKLVDAGVDAGRLNTDEGIIAETLRMNQGENGMEMEEIRKRLNVLKQEQMEELAKREGSVVVGEHGMPTVIIETIKRAEYCGDRDEAQALVAAEGLKLELPSREVWENMAIMKRQEWLSDHGVYSFYDWGEKYSKGTYVQLEGDRVTIVGANSMAEEVLNNLLSDAGSAKRVKYPADISRKSFKDKQRWLKGEGIDVIPGMAGGSVDDWKDDPEHKTIQDSEGHDVIVGIDSRDRIRRLVELKQIGADVAGHDNHEIWEDLKQKLDEKIELVRRSVGDPARPTNYHIAAELDEAVRDLYSKYDLSGRGDIIDSIISAETREEIADNRKLIDKHFDEFVKKSNKDEIEKLFKVIEDEANQVRLVQSGRLYGQAESYRRGFRRKVEQEAQENKDFADLIRWRGEKLYEGFDLAYTEITLKEPSGIWQESTKNLDKLLRFLERTDFTDQQLVNTHQKAAAMIEAIPVDALRKLGKIKESEEAEKIQEELTDRLQAVYNVNQFHSAMEHGSMKPEDVIGVFKGFKDFTFQRYFERFDRDTDGNEFVSASGDKFNVMDEAMSVYMGRLAQERKLLNFIEQWTKDRGISGDTEEEKAAIFEIKGIMAEKYKNKWTTPNLEQALSQWYRENTLVGASEKDPMDENNDIKEGRRKNYGINEQKRQLGEVLKSRLMNERGLSQAAVDKLTDDGLVEQVINNGYKFSWMFVMSDYDGIRVWDHEAEAINGKGRVGAYVFNQGTDFFHGRMLDHTWEFFVNETRGRPGKSNLIMQEGMLGERGNLLPQNRTLVRFADKLMGTIEGNTWSERVEAKKRQLKNIDRLDIDGSKPDSEWAASAAKGELIDSGEANFEGAKFSKLFDAKGSWKYLMIDLYSDRGAMMKYVDRELLQEYLSTPNSKKFFQINSIGLFYSGRPEARLKTWMKLAIPTQIAMGDKWKEWWKLQDRMPHAEKEDIIDYALQSNRLEQTYKNWMKERWCGWGAMRGYGPVRSLRQLAEVAHYGTREGAKSVGKTSVRWPFYWLGSFFQQGFKYVTT